MESLVYKNIMNACSRARTASYALGMSDTAARNRVLLAAAELLLSRTAQILAANREDLANAEKNGVRPTMLDRLALNEGRIASMAEALRTLVALPDPVGQGSCVRRPNGLEITHLRVPLGVVGMIYEARPNVTVDAAALCIKSGNAAVLRGGKEALATNRVLAALLREAAKAGGFAEDAVILIDDPTRESATAMMAAKGGLDVLIPRGGKGLIRSVVDNATVPVIETGAGNCHLYVDRHADLAMAVQVAINAKTSRPSVCNAIETLLVHRAVADDFLPRFAEACAPFGVELRGCAHTCAILPEAIPATEEDYDTEYDDLILALKVVDSTEEAMAHIRRYTTGHSEGIMTEDRRTAELFVRGLDAAAVYVNASTRFTDGGEFGLGAEIGISTQKLHVRGPMGLSALTTDKYIVRGDGQIR